MIEVNIVIYLKVLHHSLKGGTENNLENISAETKPSPLARRLFSTIQQFKLMTLFI
jgi:hypothetical protein